MPNSLARSLSVTAVTGVAVFGGLEAGAAPTASGTIAGRVAPALRPSSGSVTVARAIDVSTLEVARGGSVTKSGTYRLKAPPGVYLVAIDRIAERTAPARGYARLVRVRSGGTVSPPAIARRPQARQGSRVAGRQAVAVKEFAGSGPYAYFGRGLAAMLAGHLATSPCVDVVEWIRRAEVLAEIRLQQDRRFDPSTRVRPGRLTQPTIFVEGSVASTTSGVAATARMRDARTGRVIASVHAAGDGFAVEEEIARQLLEKLEEYCIPSRLVGTFSGENRVAGTNKYSGTIVFVRDTRSPPGLVTYHVERVSWRHTFTSETPCRANASTNVSLTRPDPALSTLVIQKGKTAKGYAYAIAAMFTSPRQLTIDVDCGGQKFTQPWVPGAALHTGPPGARPGGQGGFTDGRTIVGRYESTGTASTYTWNLRGSGAA